MRRLTGYTFFLFLLLQTACFTPEPPVIDDPEVEIETIIPTGEEQFLNENSDYIFDQEKLPTIELTIPGSALQQINNDPAAEQYVEASLTFEGETISPVGVRYKGSIGAFVGCVSGNDWANPDGFKTCTKLSMKIKINWQGADTKFYGMKKVQLHSMNNDPSQFRERLGYHLFREMNIPAPRCVHARLLINGNYQGLFALVEQIDGRWAKYNFEDDDGNLYKEIWPLRGNGQPQSESSFLSNLKTNEEDNPNADLIRTFAQEIAEAEEADLKSTMEKWMDIDEIMSYIAVDRTIRNDDGAFHWYCDGNNVNTCGPHNFYWYEEPENEKVHLIPWDLDHAFENIIENENPVTPIADNWGETRNNCQPFSNGFWGIKQRSAACDRITYAWTLYEEEYQQKLETFKEGAFSEAEIDVLLDTWMEQIREASQEATDAHDDAISIAEWEAAVSKFRERIAYARDL